jgi:hypothetical protein
LESFSDDDEIAISFWGFARSVIDSSCEDLSGTTTAAAPPRELEEPLN